MSKSLLFQIVKQILVNLVVHLFMRGGFWSMEHRPPPRDTQLPFDMLLITMFYNCHVKEVMYHRGGGSASYEKKFKTLYTALLYRNTMKNIKISLNKIWYTYRVLIPGLNNWYIFKSQKGEEPGFRMGNRPLLSFDTIANAPWKPLTIRER